MQYQAVLAYINDFWPRLIRHTPADQGTLIGLPHPYIVPSDGAMFQEMYYWDSYFSVLALRGTEHEHLIVDSAENMAYLFQRFGVIPNASRYYFTSRSQPPVFTAHILLAYDVLANVDETLARDFLQRMMAVAHREHQTVWLGTAQPHHRQVHAGLSRYFDINYLDMLASCESGWDHSTRCEDRWFEHLPVDLNAILYGRERDFSRAAELFGDMQRAEHWRLVAAQRALTITALMWDDEQGFFFDYDYVHSKRTIIPTLAGFYPLWTGCASSSQAARMVQEWLPRFEHDGGLVTSFDEQPGRQWAFPNGWAPLQWIVTTGLDNYGFHADAQRIRRKWCDLCADVFERTGQMWEKYNVVHVGRDVEHGLYGSITGFGWSNAVFVEFAKKLAEATTP